VLGHSVREIAWHKAGIVKRGVPAFSVSQTADARAVIETTASELGAPLCFVSPQHPLVARALALAGADAADAAALPTWLRPSHQLENFALAAAMVHSLAERGLLRPPAAAAVPAGDSHERTSELMDAALRAALRTNWPGRTELISAPAGAGASPTPPHVARLIFDVAHNEDAVRALLANLPRIVPPTGGSGGGSTGARASIELIFGANKDKDMRVMLAMIGELTGARGDGATSPCVLAINLVSSSHPKACPLAELAAVAREAAPDAPWRTEHATMAEALAAAASGTRAELHCTIVFGSVFVVADARAQLAVLRPDMFKESDWAFEQAGEPPIV